MKIAFLHGLESKGKGFKNEYLDLIADSVWGPKIDYREPRIYKKILSSIKEFKPDLVVGSSMGGFFAMLIGGELGVPVLAFNPAIHNRSIEVETPSIDRGSPVTRNKNLLVLGKADKVIDPYKTLSIMNKTGSRYKHLFYKDGHRVPDKIFKEGVDFAIDLFKI